MKALGGVGGPSWVLGWTAPLKSGSPPWNDRNGESEPGRSFWSVLPSTAMDELEREEFHSQVFAAQVRKLLLDARCLRERSWHLYAVAEQKVLRNRERVAQTRRLLEVHEQRRAARLLQETIFEKMNAGVLPDTGAPIVYGAPGVGGRCDACEQVLEPTQLVISVPWSSQKTFARLHAGCFMAWNAVWRSVTARRLHDVG